MFLDPLPQLFQTQLALLSDQRMTCFAIFILWWPTFIAFQVGSVGNNDSLPINQSQIVACSNGLHQSVRKNKTTTSPTTSLSTTVTPLTTTEAALQTTLDKTTTSPTTSLSTTVTPLTTTEAALQTTLDTPAISLGTSLSPLTTTCNTTSGTARVEEFIEVLSSVLKSGSYDDKEIVRNIETLERILEETDLNETTYLSSDSVSVLLYKNTDDFNGLEIQANNTKAKLNASVSNIKVKIRIPRQFNLQKNDKVVFSMIKKANNTFKTTHSLYDHLLVGLSVAGKNFSGLQDRVNISIYLTTSLMKSQSVNTTNNLTDFSTNGCETFWDDNQPYITCSCDHLTYFAVLMLSADLSPKDAEILFYITYIGCSVSLFALAVTVGLFITSRKLRADDSKKIHISLAVALILLNVHFLSSEAAAASSSTELCLYVALLLHYSLLASFTWMALEGFRLYLLLVKVFNIYVRRYLLKLSVVGWGLPVVIVSVVVIINKDTYGRASLDLSNPNGTAVCYITDDKVKMGTTVGLFSLMFLFNLIMFGITVKWFVDSHNSKERGWSSLKKAKREIVTLLLLVVLLGLTWGVIFFSFGFFIFIYFVLSLKKTKDTSSETHITRT